MGINSMENVLLSQYDIENEYKERIFGVSEYSSVWNPSLKGEDRSTFKTICTRPFCEWGEYHEMIVDAWSNEEYHDAYVIASLAIIDAQWKQLSDTGDK